MSKSTSQQYADRLREAIRKGQLALSAVKQLDNWPAYFADCFGLPRGPFVEYELRNGTKCRLRPKERHVVNDIWLSNVYCEEQEIQGGDVVIDIGAHVGVFSLFAAYRGARVYSFEPYPPNYSLLLDNLLVNAVHNRVSPFNVAVWHQRGEALLGVDEANMGAHSLLKVTGQRLAVKAVTLDEIFAGHSIENCRLLKIDAEGAEYPILYTSPPELLARIEMISCEYHQFAGTIPRNYEHQRLRKFLERQGFRVFFQNPPFTVLRAIRE